MRTATPDLLESEGELTRPVVAADDEHQATLLPGHVEAAGDERSGEPVEHDGGEDDDEDDGQHELGVGDSLVLELEAEGRCRRAGDDPARSHPGDEPSLPPCQRGPPGGEEGDERPEDQHHHQDEHDRLWQHGFDGARGDGRGDEHEEDADEQLHERLLELAGERDVDPTRRLDPALVGETDAHQRRRREARVLAQEIGRHDRCDDDHQRGEDGHPRLVEVYLAQEHPEEDRARDGRSRAHSDAQRELAESPARAHGVEDEDAEQRADRVDEHAFPLQRRPDRTCRADEGEERKHDGRTGDDEDRADQERHVVAHARDEQQSVTATPKPVTTTPTATRRTTYRVRSEPDLAEREPAAPPRTG